MKLNLFQVLVKVPRAATELLYMSPGVGLGGDIVQAIIKKTCKKNYRTVFALKLFKLLVLLANEG